MLKLIQIRVSWFLKPRISKSSGFRRSSDGSSCVVCVQGKTPADQAQEDAELSNYLSSRRPPPPSSKEDLETAVWGAHTHTHGLCTLVAEHKWEWNWDELLAAEKRWTASLRRRIFDRFNIYLYLFICVSIYWLCWWTDCLTLNSSGCKCNFTGHNELPGSAYVSRFFSASASKQKIFQNKSLWSCIYPMKPFVPKRWLWCAVTPSSLMVPAFFLPCFSVFLPFSWLEITFMKKVHKHLKVFLVK